MADLGTEDQVPQASEPRYLTICCAAPRGQNPAWKSKPNPLLLRCPFWSLDIVCLCLHYCLSSTVRAKAIIKLALRCLSLAGSDLPSAPAHTVIYRVDCLPPQLSCNTEAKTGSESPRAWPGHQSPGFGSKVRPCGSTL